MTVNHGGSLGMNYFLSYINLILVSRNCSLKQARDLTMELFFKNNIDQYGKETYERFMEAYRELEQKEV
ncbi:hypothetical protein [Pseudoneobacillus rhizosphaerae]|uniref:Uncharacterized protein n=1 Tax=Pseudoneobacillus rhizosphaerae TaxID=2880968 RepID=A0A9C7GDP7_9BACI|nr:hypothetical protein [Pseudoneobacillus rhizosphaerae]CAG9610270.1 hypothetical protein NEOCIP111885_04016 [Pseudoneobacillus rhizosphaerae]